MNLVNHALTYFDDVKQGLSWHLIELKDKIEIFPRQLSKMKILEFTIFFFFFYLFNLEFNLK